MMETLVLYLLKSTVASGIFYLLFLWLFRKESFFTFNRFYLLISLLFSYLFPLIKININTNGSEQATIFTTVQSTVNQFIFTEESAIIPLIESTKNSLMDYWWLLPAAVSLIVLFRFIKHITQLWKTIDANEKITHQNFTLVLFNQHYTFSFFRYIFISQAVWRSPNGNSIVNHELSHLKHKHSLDRLLMELMLIVFWMNPFIYLYRKALEEVHEFQADNDATKNISVKDYFNLVIQQSASQHFSPLMSPFSYQLIKKRIKMANYKSNPIKRLLVTLPFVVALLIVFASATISQTTTTFSEEEIHNWPNDDRVYNPVTVDAFKTPDAKASTTIKELENAYPRQIIIAPSKGINISKDEEISFSSPIKKDQLTKISSGFGMRKHPITKKMKQHNGVDYVAPFNTNILAIGDGTVRTVKLDFVEGKGYGRYVIIDHEDGYSSLYSQLNAYKVKEGQKVKEGDIIGLLGSSGISTGPHLHLEIKKDGQFIDPESVIN
ncbi:peptidoglycan DD-metalloendopeptidase family protein [Carboxylicivirga sp. A043]|uniref:peptidoglycan DD-metalloendopeptidase family protein n=1 Tax=Carboxylicivirga litoralis TaxID=2816963 RepID=UPI0021CB73BD|nr:peptidoglycan DD-metalloendopeptidase family protein [Carboxylicivirga sp. A043]MCU4156085.1 peptidoglycan DD-metalloendopeptidase family protein [Carboxylicivirga sp. A043]